MTGCTIDAHTLAVLFIFVFLSDQSVLRLLGCLLALATVSSCSTDTVVAPSTVSVSSTTTTSLQPTALQEAREDVRSACAAYTKRRDEMRADPDMLRDGPFRLGWLFIVADVRFAADALRSLDARALPMAVQERWDDFWNGIDSETTKFATIDEWFEAYVEVVDEYCLSVRLLDAQ